MGIASVPCHGDDDVYVNIIKKFFQLHLLLKGNVRKSFWLVCL